MAFFFGESWDLYATSADMTLGHWDTSSNLTNATLVAGRFAGSRGVVLFYQARFDKTSGQNDPVHHINVAYMLTQALGASNSYYVTFFDGATAQCSIVFKTDGSISLTLGGTAGTVLATLPAAFTTRDVWYSFEFEVVIHPTDGAFAIRKLGNPTNDLSVTGLNTRVSANSYANKISTNTVANVSGTIDDFLWRSGADVASVPWVGDVRCYTRVPVSDVLAQWTHTVAPVTIQYWGSTGIGNTITANTALYMQFTAGYSGLITQAFVSCNVSGGGGIGHVKMALFASTGTNGDVIGEILAISTEMTNPTTAGVTVTFTTPIHVTVGQIYWIGIVGDASITYSVINSTSNTPPTKVITLTGPSYGAWPANNPGGTIATRNVPGFLILTFTPDQNSDAVGEAQQDGNATYVSAGAINLADYYTINPLASTPATIVGVVTRGLFIKTDAGTRNAAVRVKSGETVVQTPSTPLNTVWGWITRVDTVDPATGVEWTPAGVNNVNIGPITTA